MFQEEIVDLIKTTSVLKEKSQGKKLTLKNFVFALYLTVFKVLTNFIFLHYMEYNFLKHWLVIYTGHNT